MSRISDTFKCDSCNQEINIFRSVHVDLKICEDCFRKRLEIQKQKKKIVFFEETLKEQGKYTESIKADIQKIYQNVESIAPKSIFDLSPQELKQNPILKKYIPRILKVHEQQARFAHFVKFLSKKTQFKKELKQSISEYITTFFHLDAIELKEKITNDLEIREPLITTPNIAKYIYENCETLYFWLLTEILPFKRKNLMVEKSALLSRVDVFLKFEYKFEYNEISIIKKELKRLEQKQLKEKRVEQKNPAVKPPVKKNEKAKMIATIFIKSIFGMDFIITDVLQTFNEKMKSDEPIKWDSMLNESKSIISPKSLTVIVRSNHRI